MSLLSEPAVRVGVTVSFLRMDAPPAQVAALPAGAVVHRVRDCGVAEYRSYYDRVGSQYLWWLRRTMSDRQLAALLRDSNVSIHRLDIGGQVSGFYELDATNWPAVNLSYFGLMPHAVGHGLGHAFLCDAVMRAWRQRPNAVTVNTCTADHPRAMPNYLRVGFRRVREVSEVWNIPTRLGMQIPETLRV